MDKTTLIGAGVLLAIGGGAALYDFTLGVHRTANVLYLDNTTDSPVEVSLTGPSEHTCSLAPGESCMVDVEAPDQYTVVGTSGGQEVHRGSFAIPENGDGTRSLYIVGPIVPYGVITVGYGAGSSNSQLIQPTAPFVELPGYLPPVEIDSAFPDSISSRGGGTSLTHLCHVDPETQTVGCPGA